MTNPFKFAAKFLAGALIILLVVGPLAYGAYGLKSLVVDCTAAMVSWVLSAFYGRLEELGKKFDAGFGANVSIGIFLGFTTGFGVGLGADLGESIGGSLGIEFVAIFAKWLTIGFTFGLSVGLLLRVGEFLAGNLVVEPEKILEPDLPGRLGYFLEAPPIGE